MEDLYVLLPVVFFYSFIAGIIYFISFISKQSALKKARNAFSMLFSMVIDSDGEVTEDEKATAQSCFDEIGEYLKEMSVIVNVSKKKINEKMELGLNAKKRKDFRFYCLIVLRAKMPYTTRLLIMKSLFKVAFAHEGIVYTEVQLLRGIARYLLIKNADLLELEREYHVTKKEQKQHAQTDYLQNLYIHTLSQSYKTLELDSTASKDDIKHAYRRLVLQFHPDKQPIEATKEATADAASKFRLVNEAYNYLRKERKIV